MLTERPRWFPEVAYVLPAKSSPQACQILRNSQFKLWHMDELIWWFCQCLSRKTSRRIPFRRIYNSFWALILVGSNMAQFLDRATQGLKVTGACVKDIECWTRRWFVCPVVSLGIEMIAFLALRAVGPATVVIDRTLPQQPSN